MEGESADRSRFGASLDSLITMTACKAVPQVMAASDCFFNFRFAAGYNLERMTPTFRTVLVCGASGAVGLIDETEACI